MTETQDKETTTSRERETDRQTDKDRVINENILGK